MIPTLYMVHRPKSVGPKADIRAVLAYRRWWQQLWRHQSWLAGPVIVKPVRINEYRGERSNPVRPKDKVMVFGDFGVVLYVNGREEAMVRVWPKGGGFEDEIYDLSLFETNPGKIPWRILG